jgi:hypothetical protein
VGRVSVIPESPPRAGVMAYYIINNLKLIINNCREKSKLKNIKVAADHVFYIILLSFKFMLSAYLNVCICKLLIVNY